MVLIIRISTSICTSTSTRGGGYIQEGQGDAGARGFDFVVELLEFDVRQATLQTRVFRVQTPRLKKLN